MHRSQLLESTPILLKQKSVLIQTLYDQYYQPYRDCRLFIDYALEQRHKWAIEHNITLTPEQLLISPPGDLYEYYRGNNGVITRQVPYNVPTAYCGFESMKKSLMTKIVGAAQGYVHRPPHFDHVALEAAQV